ncbi:kelch-like protein 40 [Haliotis rufescens]|uniref:kelch-like protein 40 n=1 Tax=Haliotis rufescens TaxID=6454 RepID=UPI001EB004A2|nr:kelch-like protein 40 [Haliotis rufescens]
MDHSSHTTGKNGDNHIILQVNETRIKCKKHVLIAKSDYFQGMFASNMKESSSDVIELKGAKADVIQLLVKSLDSPLLITEDNVYDLTEASVVYQFQEVLESCCEFLDHSLDHSNCLTVMTMADMFSLSELFHKAKTHSLWYFEDVARELELYDLPEPQLIAYLSHNALHCTDEWLVFDVLCKWYTQNISCNSDPLADSLHSNGENNVNEMDQCSSSPDNHFNDMNTDPKELIQDSSMPISVKDCTSVVVSVVAPGQFTDRHTSNNAAAVPSTKFCELLKKCVYFDMLCEQQIQKLLQHPLVAADEDARQLVSDAAALRKLHLRTRPAAQVSKRKSPTAIMCFGGHVCSSLTCVKPDQCEGNSASRDMLWFSQDTCSFSVEALTKDDNSELGENALKVIGCQVTLVDKEVFVSGGEAVLGRNTWQMTMMAFNCFTRRWCCKKVLRQPRRHHGACAVDRRHLFLIGGFGRFRKILNVVESFDVETDEWSDHPPLLQPEFSAAVAVCNNKIYVFKTQIQQYCLTTREWSFITISQPISSNVNFALTFGSSIYLCCKFTKNLRMFNPETRDCKELGHFQTECMGCVLLHGKVYWFEDFSNSPTVECFDPRDKSFEIVGKIKNCFLAGEIISVPKYPVFSPSALT